MPEVNLIKTEDFQKFIGWTVKECQVITNGADPGLLLQLSHPAAECPVQLRILSGVTFGRSGNIMVVNAQLHFNVEDLK